MLDPAIRAHLEAENAYQRALMARHRRAAKQLFHEMKGRIKEDDSSVPMKDGPFAYGSSFKIGGEQPRFFRTPRDGGPEDDHPRRRHRGRRQGLFPASAASTTRATTAGCCGPMTTRARNSTRCVIRDLDGRRRSWRPCRRHRRLRRLERRRIMGFFYTRLDANHRPSKTLLPRARHRPLGKTGWSTRKPIRASS